MLEARLHTGEGTLLVGRLSMRDRRIFFQYEPEFLTTAWDLSPIHLPKRIGLFEEKGRIFDGLPGLFYDSLPDGWGLLLMDRFFAQHGIAPASVTPLEKLAYIGQRGIGALTYHPARDMDGDGVFPVHLGELQTASEAALSGTSREVLPQLVLTGGSPGGARPKVLVGLADDGAVLSGIADLPPGYTHYMVKFSSAHDPRDMGPIERAYAIMAEEAGIRVPPTRLLEMPDGRSAFAVRRFDRIGNRRVHVQTLAALIHADHRIPNTDYETYLRVCWLLTRDHRALLAGFRRMVFNVLAHNRDDHTKNFSFLQNEPGRWQLSPAYDLVFSHGMAGEHTMTVAGEGKRPGRAHFLGMARKLGIDVPKAGAIIDEVRDAVSRWSHHAREAGVSSASQETIADAIGESVTW